MEAERRNREMFSRGEEGMETLTANEVNRVRKRIGA
jgi:hypothetical protein